MMLLERIKKQFTPPHVAAEAEKAAAYAARKREFETKLTERDAAWQAKQRAVNTAKTTLHGLMAKWQQLSQAALQIGDRVERDAEEIGRHMQAKAIRDHLDATDDNEDERVTERIDVLRQDKAKLIAELATLTEQKLENEAAQVEAREELARREAAL
jgi:hypothetical protein